MVERDLAGQRRPRRIPRHQWRAAPFTAELSGSWDGRTLVLVEALAFEDGERDRKTWRLERVGLGRYRGTREDVVGESMSQDGDVFRLSDNLRLPSE
ncbi:MAG: DUF3833 family protein [Hyphomonadaceae bacterium]